MTHGVPYMQQWQLDEIEKAENMTHKSHIELNFAKYVAITAAAVTIAWLTGSMVHGLMADLAAIRLEVH